ncbi:hypothetical protein [Paenibacillus agilis]|uniref:Uncharacterized protein n=1 Tax=Paenibacillus agilis TaxID=3020863 RepID=A0A559IX90_9BACL|nr:hypothetical protein [Paenibacillus agilis]TVX92211.1 hypothetical protein FPZ44_03545 [Paenibacillus agilis]
MNAKRQLHKKADEKNRLESRRGKTVLCCGANKPIKKGGGFCKALAGTGTDHPGYGRCKYCGGMNTGPKTAAGKAAVSQNARKHGFYSKAISPEEREVYEEQLEEASLGLQHEIYMLKAKILVYLSRWRRRWDRFYKAKLAEEYVKYKCMNPDCGAVHVYGELEVKPGYCISAKCGEKHLEEVERWVAERTPVEAEEYADRQTKVYFTDGENGRSYYHAGSLEDRTLDRALNTLGRLIEKHARLTQDSGDDLLTSINKELQAASQGKVSVSWGGKPQARTESPAE